MYLIDYVGISLKAKTKNALMRGLEMFLAERGVEVWSYHVLMEHLIGLHMNRGFIHNTFPKDWVRRYVSAGYFDTDPIIAYARMADEPFAWRDVGHLMALAPAQRDYLAVLEARFADGYGVPIRGAMGTVAYFGVGSPSRALALDRAELIVIQLACHQTHTRFLQLNGTFETPPPQLTAREREVLTWAARGKSNAVIAEILGVSEHTVNTLLRRVYAKYAVHDRVSAILRAVGQGAIVP